MSRVAVNKSILKWALDRSKHTIDSLRRKFPKLEEWFKGEIQPTLKQLEAFAKITSTPFGFFFLTEPPEENLPIPHFRTQSSDEFSKPSPELFETIHNMQQRQNWMREFLIEEKQRKLLFVGSATINDKSQTIAQNIRELLRFEENWASEQNTWTDALRFLRETIETAGILVVVNGIVGNNTSRKLDPGEFRGFVLVDEYAPLVFVNGSDSKAAQMFTLGHELAHIFFGSSAAFDLRQLQPADDPIEIACNKVAAEFIVPELELNKYWKSVQSKNEPFQAIARHFKVSVLVAARRTLDLNLINRNQFIDFYNHYRLDERRKRIISSGGGDFYRNQNLRVGRRFASAIIQAVRQERLLYSEAYRLTGLYGKTFEAYKTKLEGGV